MIDPKTLPLRDIHLPPAVSPWWPLAPGWWMLVGALVVLALTAGAARWWWRRTALRRAARHALARINDNFAAHQNCHRLAAELSMLCRQIALARNVNDTRKSNSSVAWLGELDRTTKNQFFTAGPGEVLATAPYDPKAHFDAQTLLAGLAAWLKQLPPAPRGAPADV